MNEDEGGVVQIVKGRHAGRFGYWDDDSEEGLAIVYLGRWRDGYVMVRRSSLAEPTFAQEAEYGKLMKSPDYY